MQAFLQLWDSSLLWCMGLSLQWLLLWQSTGFRSCGTLAQEQRLTSSRAQAQQLWHVGLVALQQVGSSQIRDRTCVSCTGRQILYYRATGEVPKLGFLTELNSPEIQKSRASQFLSFHYLTVHSMEAPVCLTSHLPKNIWAVSRFCYYE